MRNRFWIISGDYQRGQILLISIFILVIALTVGLSVSARIILTNRMTSAEDSSQRAFSAAEAGLERALTASVDTTLTGTFTSNNSDYSTSISSLTGTDILANNGSLVLKDDSVDIWLSNYPGYTSPFAGSLDIYWGKSGDVCVGTPESSNTMAALEVILVSGTRDAPVISHFAYDPCAARRSGSNNFSPASAGGTVKGKTFTRRATISVSDGLLARIIPLYASTYIAVRGTGLPSQGTIITSVGRSGGTQRKIVSFRGYPKAPIEFYPFLIFSPK